MPEGDNGEGRRSADPEEPISPAAGRILGAGSNNLQRAIDANTRATEALLTELKSQAQRRGRSRGVGASRARTTSVGGAGELTEPTGTWTAEEGRRGDGTTYRVRDRTVTVPQMAVPYRQRYDVSIGPDGSRTVSSMDQAPTGAQGGRTTRRTTTISPMGVVTASDWSTRAHGPGIQDPYDLSALHATTPRYPRYVNTGRTVNADTGYSTYRSAGAAAYQPESSGAGSRVFVAGPTGAAALRRPGAAQNEERREEDGGYYSSRSRTVPLPGGRERAETFTESRTAAGASTFTTSIRAPRDDGRGYSTRIRTTTTSPTGRVSRSERTLDELTDLDSDSADWDERRFHRGWGPTGGGGPEPPSTPPVNWKNLARNAQRTADKVGGWGTALVKSGSVMDTYSQWAGIANAGGADSVNAIRKFVFGGGARNLTGWAQNVQDAQAAAFLASRNAGFTELTPGTKSINPQFANYMGGIKDLALLNPTMNASSIAGMAGQLTSVRGLYAAQMYGYQPMLGRNGQIERGALGSFTDSIMRRTFQGKEAIAPEELKASLGQNGSLHANIQAYVNSVGGGAEMTRAIEDYVTGRNTAASKGLSGKEFDQLMADYERGGDAGRAAEKRLQKFGVSNTILQSQKDRNAAKSGNISDLMDSLGPAVKQANEALEKFQNLLNEIVNTGVGQSFGTLAGWGSAFGPAMGSAFGAMAGMRMGGGALGMAGSLLGMRSLGGAGAGAGLVGALGGRTALLRAGGLGAAAAGVSAVGDEAVSHIGNSTGRRVGGVLVNAGTGALTGAALGSVFPVVGTGIGAAVGGAIGAGYGVMKNFFGGDDHKTGNDGRDGGASSSKKKGSSSATNGETVAGKSASGAIRAALSQVGKPYIWGGTGPDGFDCSGLMQYAYRKAGVRLPRVSQDQMKVGKKVSRKNVRPGDLMFPNPGHVVMYIGGEKIVEAPRTGKDIRVGPVSTYKGYQAIRRIVGSVGSYSGPDADQDDDTDKKQGDNLGGDSGSTIISDGYGSTEEVDAISSAIASLKNTPIGSSSASANEDEDSGDTGSASAGAYDFGPIDGKYTDVPAPPGWLKSAILKGMSAAGVSGAKWARGLVTIAYRESGFRKGAVNRTDSNAKRGTPSQGIMQVIRPTFNAYRAKSLPNDPFNPAASVAASANYIEGRYGDIDKVQQANPNKPPRGYREGAWQIPEDQVAEVHKGEMIIEKPKADSIRNVLLRDVVPMRDPASGRNASQGQSGGGIVINFQPGSVQFSVTGPMTSDNAKAAADSFSKALTQDSRLKALAKGL